MHYWCLKITGVAFFDLLHTHSVRFGEFLSKIVTYDLWLLQLFLAFFNRLYQELSGYVSHISLVLHTYPPEVQEHRPFCIFAWKIIFGQKFSKTDTVHHVNSSCLYHEKDHARPYQELRGDFFFLVHRKLRLMPRWYIKGFNFDSILTDIQRPFDWAAQEKNPLSWRRIRFQRFSSILPSLFVSLPASICLYAA